MKVNTTTLILGVSLAVVAGLFGTTIFGVADFNNTALTSAGATGLITGHVTTTLTDAAGNIKEYRQSDNLIVNEGENCASKMLFGGSGGATVGTGVCTGSNTAGFTTIAIGNSTMLPASDQYKLGQPYNATGGVPSLVPKQGTVNWNTSNSTGNGAGTTAKVVISTTYTSTQAAAQTVSESGLFNSTNDNTNAMFARQQFTGISMNNGDSLTVQWTINIGGTGNALTP